MCIRDRIYDEKNGLNYTLHGDYYLPDLEITEEEPTYRKSGIMRKQFLKEHRSACLLYTSTASGSYPCHSGDTGAADVPLCHGAS